MDKVHYMDEYVIQTLVVMLCIMSSYGMFCFATGDIIEMGLESVHKSVFGHTYVLYFASGASYTVY